ncbi:MAG: hypothetical protein M1334_01735 [Patescibacteria group bacterium]|nr:hypothetical protein [Patescibacteria group bacterium]
MEEKRKSVLDSVIETKNKRREIEELVKKLSKLNIMVLLNYSLDNFSIDDSIDDLKRILTLAEEKEWFKEVLKKCKENNITICLINSSKSYVNKNGEVIYINFVNDNSEEKIKRFLLGE